MKNKVIIAFLVILSVIAVSVLFFTKSPESIISRLPYLGDFYKNTSLTISSKNSINAVSIDGKEYGDTPLEIKDLEEGQHSILLTRKTDEGSEKFYEPVTMYIDLQRKTEAIIDLEIAPGGYQSGYVLYYTPSPNSKPKTGYITATTEPAEAEIKISNGQKLTGGVDVLELPTGEYTLEISNTGYESITFPVIIREEFNLNISAYLLPIPVNLTTKDNG